MAFTFDTSGRVAGNFADLPVWYEFPDLYPFMQGYVRAAIVSLGECIVHWRGPEERTERYHAGFRHLAPATLAAMMADCEAFQRRLAGVVRGSLGPWTGEQFWETRQRGILVPTFPPLTLTIGDDGKVYQEARP